MICNCYFYGRSLLPATGMNEAGGYLIETHGNQCALVVRTAAPCRMETPDWSTCPFKTLPAARAIADAAFWFPTIDLSENHAGVVAVTRLCEPGEVFEVNGTTHKLVQQITNAEFRHTRGMMKMHGRLDRPDDLNGIAEMYDGPEGKRAEFTPTPPGQELGPEFIQFWRAERKG